MSDEALCVTIVYQIEGEGGEIYFQVLNEMKILDNCVVGKIKGT